MADVRRIVITGVSRGLGLALVEAFAEMGHVVAGCARSAEVIRTLAAQHEGPHDFQTVDVTDQNQVRQWAHRVLARLGPPDLLINNAAIINQNANLWETAPEEFSRVVDVNLKGVFYTIRYFVPAMVERGEGVIVNFSSGWGRSTSPHVGPYCATKWAIEGLSRALADELPVGMAAVPVNPGVIHTRMLETCWGPEASQYKTPQQWARSAAPFLLELGPDDSGDALTAPS